MRLYLAEKPFEPDSVRMPCPCADQGKVMFYRTLLRGPCSARRDERHRCEPVRGKSQRRAIIFGEGEDETRLSAKTAFQAFQNAGLTREQELLDEASSVGGIF